jgi:uncharacterized protein (TIGR04255 family)
MQNKEKNNESLQINKKKYTNNFLSEIIFRIDFSKDIKIENNFEEFFASIKHVFKHYEAKTKPEISIKIEGDKGKIKTSKNPFAWCFFDKKRIEDSIIMEIRKDHISLDFIVERTKYENFNDFKKYIELICDALSVYKVKYTKYIGLRYINKIICDKGNPFKWKDIINSDLLSLKLLNKYDNKTKFMSDFRFKKDDFDIVFKFGLFNSEYPNPIARKEFVLDYDCNTDEVQNLLDIEDISEKMNSIIYNLFEESIERKLRDIMK